MKTIEELRNAYVAPIVEAHAECRWCDAGELEEMLNEAYIAGATASQEWISVEDELPKYGQLVICKNDNSDPKEVGYFVAQYVDDMFYINDEDAFYEDQEPTHWRPIEYK